MYCTGSKRLTAYYFVSIETVVVRPLVSVGFVGPQLPPLKVTSRGEVVPAPRPARRPLVVPRHVVLVLVVVMSPTVRIRGKVGVINRRCRRVLLIRVIAVVIVAVVVVVVTAVSEAM